MEGGLAEGTSFDEFFNDWRNGQIPFGSWMDHVLSYVPAFANNKAEGKNEEDGRQFLFLTYEELIQDLPGAVETLVAFLELPVTAEEQKELLPTFSFAHMKSESHRFQPKSVQWKNQFSFLRKGQSGDAKTIVTEEQRKSYDEAACRFEATLRDRLGEANREVLNKITQLLHNG